MQFKINQEEYNRWFRFKDALSELNEFLDREIEIGDFQIISGNRSEKLVPMEIQMMDCLIDLLPNPLVDKLTNCTDLIFDSQYFSTNHERHRDLSEEHEDWDYLIKHKLITLVKTPAEALLDMLLNDSEMPLNILYDERAKEGWKDLLSKLKIKSMHSTEGPVYDMDAITRTDHRDALQRAIKFSKYILEKEDDFRFIADVQNEYHNSLTKSGERIKKEY